MVETEPRRGHSGWYPAPGGPDGVEQFWTGTRWADLYRGPDERPPCSTRRDITDSPVARIGCAVLALLLVVAVVAGFALAAIGRGWNDSPMNPGPNLGDPDGFAQPSYFERASRVWEGMDDSDRNRVCRLSAAEGISEGAALMVEISSFPASNPDELRVVGLVLSIACCAPLLEDPGLCPD